MWMLSLEQSLAYWLPQSALPGRWWYFAKLLARTAVGETQAAQYETSLCRCWDTRGGLCDSGHSLLPQERKLKIPFSYCNQLKGQDLWMCGSGHQFWIRPLEVPAILALTTKLEKPLYCHQTQFTTTKHGQEACDINCHLVKGIRETHRRHWLGYPSGRHFEIPLSGSGPLSW